MDFPALCAGGTLSEEDKDAVMKALQDIYWESKQGTCKIYTKKFKNPDYGTVTIYDLDARETFVLWGVERLCCKRQKRSIIKRMNL